jgi:hypothetical protein
MLIALGVRTKHVTNASGILAQGYASGESPLHKCALILLAELAYIKLLAPLTTQNGGFITSTARFIIQLTHRSWSARMS